MLDLKLDRPGATPKDAATVILVRDGEGERLEVFCVERSKQSRFLGGAIVFPGGKLDAADADPAFVALASTPHPRAELFATSAEHGRALAIAAARETLEEAAILPAAGVTQDELFALRASLATVGSAPAILAFLRDRRLRLDLAELHPFARWITPEAEARRFDARFFLTRAPVGLRGAHDELETMASFWATPAETLRRFAAGEVQLAPPTHRTLELLGACANSDAAIALADRCSLEPICPRLVPQGEAMALVLPGDPEHAVKDVRVPGRSRYVLRGEQWMPENAP